MSCTFSGLYGEDRSRVVNNHRLNLGEKIEAIGPFFTAPAALLHAAPGGCVVEGIVTIYPYGSRVQRGGSLMRFAQIARPHAGGQPEARVVALLDRLGEILERQHTGHRAKNFFACDAHPVIYIGKNGRFYKEAAGQGAVRGPATRHWPGFLLI